jgi:hypothetical protein
MQRLKFRLRDLLWLMLVVAGTGCGHPTGTKMTDERALVQDISTVNELTDAMRVPYAVIHVDVDWSVQAWITSGRSTFPRGGVKTAVLG